MPDPVAGYSPVLCRQCRRTLARLYAGKELSITIRCPKCKMINVIVLGTVVPEVARAEPLKREADGSALPAPRVHQVRLAAN